MIKMMKSIVAANSTPLARCGSGNVHNINDTTSTANITKVENTYSSIVTGERSK